MVDEPKGNCYGGTVAAPVVRNIIKRTLDYHYGLVPESQLESETNGRGSGRLLE